jgi:hypothetical protein
MRSSNSIFSCNQGRRWVLSMRGVLYVGLTRSLRGHTVLRMCPTGYSYLYIMSLTWPDDVTHATAPTHGPPESYVADRTVLQIYMTSHPSHRLRGLMTSLNPGVTDECNGSVATAPTHGPPESYVPDHWGLTPSSAYAPHGLYLCRLLPSLAHG